MIIHLTVSKISLDRLSYCEYSSRIYNLIISAIDIAIRLSNFHWVVVLWILMAELYFSDQQKDRLL